MSHRTATRRLNTDVPYGFPDLGSWLDEDAKWGIREVKAFERSQSLKQPRFSPCWARRELIFSWKTVRVTNLNHSQSKRVWEVKDWEGEEEWLCFLDGEETNISHIPRDTLSASVVPIMPTRWCKNSAHTCPLRQMALASAATPGRDSVMNPSLWPGYLLTS